MSFKDKLITMFMVKSTSLNIILTLKKYNS